MALYEKIATTPGLVPGGLHAYDGHNHQEALADRKHEEGHWALGHGWTVVREVAKGERTYRAAAKSGD